MKKWNVSSNYINHNFIINTEIIMYEFIAHISHFLPFVVAIYLTKILVYSFTCFSNDFDTSY
ncbi:MAG: hypothetical protein RL664_1787 [Bacteroidota bacterium]